METNSVAFFGSKDYPGLKNIPLVAAWQIVNPGNIGSIMRVADNVGCEEVFILGEDFSLRTSSIKKTAGLSFNNVKLHFIKPEKFFQLIPEGYKLVAIETCEGSKNIFKTKLPEKIVFLLGAEKHGLPEEMISKCDSSVHIPMTGNCKSMNVSHALAVGLFEWQRQMLF